jgi:hypothetical protein
MAHFAELDANNKVIRVLVIDNEHEDNGQEYLAEILGFGGTWMQTSYNSKIRGKYAGIGDFYDETLDRFISPSPYKSWLLGDDFNWYAPKPMPNDEKVYNWNEKKLDWILIETPSI